MLPNLSWESVGPCSPRELGEELLLSAARHLKRLGELRPSLLSEPARYWLPFESDAARASAPAAPPVRSEQEGRRDVEAESQPTIGHYMPCGTCSLTWIGCGRCV